MEKYSIAGLFVLIPWIGVYVVTITCELMGIHGIKTCAAIIASLISYAAIAVVIIGMERAIDIRFLNAYTGF